MTHLSTSMSTDHPKALRHAARFSSLFHKYQALWGRFLCDLSNVAHKKALAHDASAAAFYHAAASLHRRADYLEAVQREKDALAVRDHLASLLSDADDELLACRQEASAAAHALSPWDIADLNP